LRCRGGCRGGGGRGVGRRHPLRAREVAMIALWLCLSMVSLAPEPPSALEAANETRSGAPAPGAVPDPVEPLTWAPPPRAGQETTLTLTDLRERPVAGATVQVVYREGLGGERQRAVGITDSRGRVRWTPELSGVVEIRAGDT